MSGSGNIKRTTIIMIIRFSSCLASAIFHRRPPRFSSRYCVTKVSHTCMVYFLTLWSMWPEYSIQFSENSTYSNIAQDSLTDVSRSRFHGQTTVWNYFLNCIYIESTPNFIINLKIVLRISMRTFSILTKFLPKSSLIF